MRVELFRSKNKQFALRLRASNGKILLSSETYKRRRSADNIADQLRSDGVPVVDLTVPPSAKAEGLDVGPTLQ